MLHKAFAFLLLYLSIAVFPVKNRSYSVTLKIYAIMIEVSIKLTLYKYITIWYDTIFSSTKLGTKTSKLI